MSVWAPTQPSADPYGYPVMFWIHGGAFEQGLGDCALYNGSYFAQKDVVVVAINYRLGALGFMASSSMDGNYGIQDQILALQWVQRNIKGFWGNPARVTIAGQSAGAMSVGALLISPSAKGLYDSTLMESNPLGLPFHGRDTAAMNADAMMEYLGCATDDVSCMKTKSVEDVLDAQKNAPSLNLNNLFINFLPWSPLVEANGLIPEQPLTALAAGKMVQTGPMMQGSLQDEGQLFVHELFTSPLSEVAYELTILAVFGRENYREIMRLYPFKIAEDTTDGRDSLNAIATDLLFFCPLRNVTRGYQAVLGSEETPSYLYRFLHVLSFDAWGPGYDFCVGWVCHGSELPFVFNVFAAPDEDLYYEPTADELALMEDLSNMWANFVTSGNPNTGLPIPEDMPQYSAARDAYLMMEEPGMDTQSHIRHEYCNLWDRLGYFY